MAEIIQAKEKVLHTIDPVYNSDSKILILGTMPSPKSREIGFYYSHPRNRFWKVLSCVLEKELPITNNDKKSFLLENRIALWDILESCDINNADDSSISNPIANDLSVIFCVADIKVVFTTGKKATELYRKYCLNHTNKMQPIYLPSTSPANAAAAFDKLEHEYKQILKFLGSF